MKVFDRLEERARRSPRHIVLIEGEDERVIQGAQRAVAAGIARVTLLGEPARVGAAARAVGIEEPGFEVMDPLAAETGERYGASLHALRRHKGLDEEQAREMIRRPLYFGPMMVREGAADGCVGGAVHATSDMVRAAIQVVGARAGVGLVSSFFFMMLCEPYHDRKGGMIFADCGLNVDPNAEQLAEIAMASADTARNLLDEEPLVAMLSFSTLRSADHPSVEKVIEATEIVRKRRPELLIDGDVQFDAALVPEISARKSPDSKVRGLANVLVFPNLDAGNIGYKMAERIGHAVAVGPILQGLGKPVNDLSRGCSAEDVYRVIAITVLQAQDVA